MTGPLRTTTRANFPSGSTELEPALWSVGDSKVKKSRYNLQIVVERHKNTFVAYYCSRGLVLQSVVSSAIDAFVLFFTFTCYFYVVVLCYFGGYSLLDALVVKDISLGYRINL